MRLLSNGLKTGPIIRLKGQSAPTGVVTIGPAPARPDTGQAPPSLPAHDADVLGTARQLAQAMVQEAEQKARQLEEAGRQQLALWRQQQEEELNRLREAVRQEAYQDGWEQGYEEGYREGVAKAEAEWQKRLEEINSQLQEALRLKQAMLAETETELIHLCIALVRKIIGQMVQEQENTVRQMIQQALRETQAPGRIRLMVHPADLSAAESIYRELSLLAPGEPLEVLADPDVQRPGCIIQTEHGIVEATLDAQLETIREHFLALRDKENGYVHSPVEVS